MIKQVLKKVLPRPIKRSIALTLRLPKTIKYFNALLKGNALISYSQEGEDILIRCALHHMKKAAITYLDVGCNDPNLINNTALLKDFFKITKGVAVEPNPDLCKKIRRARPSAVVLNEGLCATSNEGHGGGGRFTILCIK